MRKPNVQPRAHGPEDSMRGLSQAQRAVLTYAYTQLQNQGVSDGGYRGVQRNVCWHLH